jgi:Co/Zn/Cd efflux system component
MLLFGLVVVADAIRKLVIQEVPAAEWMGAVGALALFANGVCFVLLYRHRADDLNMRSTWMCSRNDLFANSSVIIAAGLVALTNTLWPDIIVGLAIAALFLHSAWQVIREGMEEWRAGGAETADKSSKDEGDTAGNSCCSSSQSTCANESREPSR